MDRAKLRVSAIAPSLVAVGAFAVVIGVALGVLSVHSSLLALVVGVVVLLAGVAARDATIIPVLAVPATLVLTRVGGAFSVSDVVLAVASVLSLFALRGRGSAILRPLIWAGVFYLATAIPTQILNPYSANVIEWVHEVFLVLGSLIVGFVIGRADRARLALTLYVLGCCGIGVVTIAVSLVTYLHTKTFQPVFLTDLNKNTIGGMLGAAAVIAFARPVWLRWSPGWSWLVVIISTLGVVAAQSRQGLVC